MLFVRYDERFWVDKMHFVLVLLVGVYFGWQAHEYFSEPKIVAKIVKQNTLKPLVKKVFEKTPITTQVSKSEATISLAIQLIRQSKIDKNNGQYISALNAIEVVLGMVQDDYPQVELEQLFINISALYLAQLGDTNAIQKQDFLLNAVNVLPNYLQFHYLLGQLLLEEQDYESARYHLDFLANHRRWKKQFDTLENAINYAEIFEQGEIKIPLIKQPNAWHIKAIIDGKTARLILDTGASITTLGAHLVDINYPHLSEITLSTANGKINAFRVNIRNFSIDGVNKYQFPVVILPQRKLPSNIDGLLGLDWLSNFNFVIDKKNSVLQLTPNSKITE
ncbi:MAG: hypothetical protein Ctma_1614 [Catillopecten margaritatus gill symbiont]|uniref:Peptidase A2 domain-containing protein n=1 Tax=Catillopecten margaritatus gill symbiont TaxID=3083288 RepID=A0AAU6PJF1_9GAMM